MILMTCLGPETLHRDSIIGSAHLTITFPEITTPLFSANSIPRRCFDSCCCWCTRVHSVSEKEAHFIFGQFSQIITNFPKNTTGPKAINVNKQSARYKNVRVC